MKNIKCIFCLIIILPLLTSCGVHKFLGTYDEYGVEELSESYIENRASLLLTSIKKQKIENTDKPFLPDHCIDGSATSDTTKSKQCTGLRTIIVGDLMAMSKQMCEEHKRSIWGNEANFNLITGTLTNIFSGAATVVTGGAGQATLAALALLSNAERSLGNETVYKNMLIHAIVQKITERRKELKSAISNKIITSATKDYYQYPINAALGDVMEYHYACSFMSGLELAIKEGTNDRTPQKIAGLQNLLTTLSIQIDKREQNLTRDNKNVATDLRLNSLKDRYTAASNSLISLENGISESSLISGNTETSEM